MFLRIVFSLIICIFTITSAQITIATASYLENAMKEICSSFTQKTGDTVKVVYGSSGKLTAQIKNGAPFDLFLAADMSYPDSLSAAGLSFNKPVQYAAGTIALWTLKDYDLTNYLKLLQDSSVTKIAIADPRTAPYGKAALEFLQNVKVLDKIQKKLVYGDNISQATQYVLTGAVEIGFTAKSLLMAPQIQSKGHWIGFPENLSPSIPHGMVILSYGHNHNPEISQAFYSFILSDIGQAILGKYNLSLVKRQ